LNAGIPSLIAALLTIFSALPQASWPDKKSVWKPVQFAIVRFNEAAPQTWNIYHTEKRDNALLVKLWKRWLYLDLKEEEAYEVDPQTVKPEGDNVEWSLSNLPADPIEVSDWKVRDVSAFMRRVRFRFGKNGHYLDIQIPLKPDGKPAY
jgi:hypothetical protein